MKQTIDFNMNHYVWVRLTDRGRAIHCQQYYDLCNYYGKILYDYQLPKEDEAGWSRWQMHELMKTFGAHCLLGGDVPFETTIKIETEGN